MKAILVGVNTGKDLTFKDNLKEVISLAEACNIEVIQTLTQNLNAPHARTYLNSGKLDELKEIIDENTSIEAVLFDKEISPSQLRNVEEHLQMEVIDKTNLILRIFEIRAQTREAKLQVEIAKYKYQLPRLAGTYAGLDKQRGGNQNKGSGEKKLELDARHLEYRIQCLNKELKIVQQHRQVQRSLRNKKETKSVAIIGYTNAGKSSLLNQIMKRFKREHKLVFEKDMLFATLTTQTRSITLQNNHHFVLSDTVGFVSDLPHTLIKAFHSTLEEVVQADLLLHVMDISNPDYQNHKNVTLDTLRQIGAQEIPIINVYNKCDLTDLEYPLYSEDKVYISSKDNVSIEFLLDIIDKTLFESIRTCVFVPYHHGDVVAYLNEKASILKQEFHDEGTFLEIEIEKNLEYQVLPFVIDSLLK